MHLNSELLFRKYALNYFSDNIRILEIGADSFPSHYSKIVNSSKINWDTLDIGDGVSEIPNHIISHFEYNYPIENETYNIIIAGQVMEHVKNIWKWVDELKRITKKNGYLIIISPISWPYHEAPVDCWRIYPEGMKALLEEKGLKIELNHFESLEKDLVPSYIPTIPGKSTLPLNKIIGRRMRAKFLYNRFLSVFPILNKLRVPITISYDNICVCKISS